jgi:hypothetical protein
MKTKKQTIKNTQTAEVIQEDAKVLNTEETTNEELQETQELVSKTEIAENTNMTEVIQEDAKIKKYKIITNCFVCNFGYKINDILSHDDLLKCLLNEGMIQNFINSNDIIVI